MNVIYERQREFAKEKKTSVTCRTFRYFFFVLIFCCWYCSFLQVIFEDDGKKKKMAPCKRRETFLLESHTNPFLFSTESLQQQTTRKHSEQLGRRGK